MKTKPDRLELSKNVFCQGLGDKSLVSTEANSNRKFGSTHPTLLQRWGAGLEKPADLNCLPCKKLAPLFGR